MPINASDPRLQKSLLGGILLAGLLYSYFFTTWVPFTYKANAAELKGLETHYLDMSKDLNKARQATHRLPYLEKEYELLHRKWEQSQALLPERQDMAWLLRTITLLGTQAGVEFTLFHPLPSRPAQYHTENPIEIKVVGGYHQIGAFLAEVANLERVIHVDDLEVQTGKEKNSEQPAEASFVASTYTLGGTGVAPEDEAAKDDKGAPKGGAKGAAGAARGAAAGAKPAVRGGK
jgi:type IV pilus assembly protein PilO